MTLTLQLGLRLLCAGAFGALIGYEREHRGKGAGIRTHVLVALGSCLFMIISQYGFEGAERFDAARVAAGVVGGLGFLGGGIIMKTKHVVGLTTAAGIWVTGAIGLALGSGMYAMAGLCAVLLLLCMEALHFYTVRFGERQTEVVLSSDKPEALMDAIQALGKQVGQCSWLREGDRFKADISLLVKKKDFPLAFLRRLEEMKDVQVDAID